MVFLPQNSLVPGEISAECQARFGRRVVASDSLQIERRARHQQPVNQRTQNSWGTHTQHLAQSQHSLAQPQPQHSRGGREQWTQTGGPHSSASPAPRLTYLLLEATHRGGCVLLGPVSGEVLEDLRSPVRRYPGISTQYLHSIYTVSTQYLRCRCRPGRVGWSWRAAW